MTCCTSAKWVGPAKTALQLQSCAVGIHESAQNKTVSPHAVSDWCRKRGHCHFRWSQGMGDTQLKLDPKALITPWLLPAPPPPTSPSSSSLLLIHSRVPPGRPGHQYDTQKECVGSGTSTWCLCHSNPRINLCKFCPLPTPHPTTSPSLSPSHPELALE